MVGSGPVFIFQIFLKHAYSGELSVGAGGSVVEDIPRLILAVQQLLAGTGY